MRRLCLFLALAACSKSSAPNAGSASGSGPGSASGSATVTAPPDAAPASPAYTPAADVPAAIRDAIAAADRDAADRALDAGRKPGEVLAFVGVAPGQRVAELLAGGGYTTELLARVVGPTGKVWAQNTTELLDRFAREPWSARAAKPVLKGVVALERPLEDPFPADVRGLDLVVSNLVYHDMVWMKVDRAKMNKAVFDALAPGGVYAVIDHSAAAGSGTRDVQTLHRIDEQVVRQEVTAAGFVVDATSDVLRNPDDARDWSSSPRKAGARRGTSDRFVLRFKKPAP